MILLYALLSMADASRLCVASLDGSWVEDEYRAHAVIGADAGTPPCRSIDLGSRLEWRLRSAKVTLRQWDDTKQIFGSERIFAEGDRWVLHVPELRSEETVSVRVSGERVEVSKIWREPAVVPIRISQVLDMEWIASGSPKFGPDGTVARVVKVERVEPAVKGVHRQWWPHNSRRFTCQASVDGQKIDVDINQYGCAVRVEDGDRLTWSLSWLDPAVSSSDEWLLDSGDTVRLRGAEFVSQGIEPMSNKEGLQFEGPGRLSMRVQQIDGEIVENNALAEVLYAAKAVSLPEPGVGIEFKGFRGDESAIPVLLQKLRTQVVTGSLPGAHALKPRKLMAVRKSRWGTPWEQALILARYLQQLKLPAEAYAVRPALLGPTVEGAPLGFSGAVVRVDTVGRVMWLDPSCAVCGVGEISPSLWGGTLFDEAATRLPGPPDGSVVVQPQGAVLEVILTGVQALDVRRWLTEFPVDARPKALAERFGGAEAKLVSHQGLIELGQPITLRIEPQSRK